MARRRRSSIALVLLLARGRPLPARLEFGVRLARRIRSVDFAGRVALYLFATATGGAFAVQASQPERWVAVLLALVDPAWAMLALLALAAASPSLVHPRRLVFPLPLTLPLVYAALLSAIWHLRVQPAHFLETGPFRAALVWGQPLFLGAVTLGQILLLSAVALLRPRARRVQ